GCLDWRFHVTLGQGPFRSDAEARQPSACDEVRDADSGLIVADTFCHLNGLDSCWTARFAFQPRTIPGGKKINCDGVVCCQNYLEAPFKGGVLQTRQQWLNFAKPEKVAWFVQEKHAAPFSGHSESGFENE